MEKLRPTINTELRAHSVLVPEVIRKASGIVINGKRIKSIIFSTDVAIVANCNSDAIIAVYPFTPTLQITDAIISVAQKTVFVGVGGGTTKGQRVKKIALDAELHGASGVVVNAPTNTQFVEELASLIDIPVILSVVSLNENLKERICDTHADIINVSGGKDTVELIKKIREIDQNIPIMATGGPSDKTIEAAINAGANAITYTPPSNGEIFKELMEKYRQNA